MSELAAFGTGPAEAGFWRSVANRFTAVTLAGGAVVLLALTLLAGYGLVTIAWNASWPTRLARLFQAGFTLASIFVAVIVADEAVDRGMPPLPSYGLAIAGAAIVGALLGWQLRDAIGLRYGPHGEVLGGNAMFSIVRRVDMVIMCALVGSLATFAHVKRRTALAARRRQHEAERARARAQRRTIESRLQALQARVEPMFLFDTLGRIHDLYRSDPQAAGTMLEDLIEYLRAALPHLRESSSTADQEARLARAWLDIVARSTPLRARFAISEGAHEARVPALVVLPLVQHAIGRRSEAAIDVGLEIDADTDRMHIVVSTSTSAFAAAGPGKGAPLLEEITARLHALYGTEARLDCSAAADGSGSAARIEFPFERLASPVAAV